VLSANPKRLHGLYRLDRPVFANGWQQLGPEIIIAQANTIQKTYLLIGYKGGGRY
jgi:hypothetical protein